MLHLCPLNTQIHWFHWLWCKYKFALMVSIKLQRSGGLLATHPLLHQLKNYKKECKKKANVQKEKTIHLHCTTGIQSPMCVYYCYFQCHVLNKDYVEHLSSATWYTLHSVHLLSHFLVFNCVNIVPGTVYLPCWFRLRLSGT